MSIYLFRLYEQIQSRAVRLSLLCAFVVTFIGLPAFGQYMGTNVFRSLDVVDYLGGRIDHAAVSMEEARYQSYLAQSNQLQFQEEDQLVMLAEETIEEEKPLWSVEHMFKNVFSPTR